MPTLPSAAADWTAVFHERHHLPSAGALPRGDRLACVGREIIQGRQSEPSPSTARRRRVSGKSAMRFEGDCVGLDSYLALRSLSSHEYPAAGNRTHSRRTYCGLTYALPFADR